MQQLPAVTCATIKATTSGTSWLPSACYKTVLLQSVQPSEPGAKVESKTIDRFGISFVGEER
jgi:hypothetical protein